MSQNTIRVSYVDYFPMANPECPQRASTRLSPRCLMPGLAVEIFNLLASHLNLTIVPIWKEHRPNDNYSYVFDELREGRTDVYAYMWEETASRMEDFQFTQSLYNVHSYYVVRKADQSMKNIFDFFSVFSWDLWIALSIVFILFTFFALCVQKLESRLMLRPSEELWNTVWRMVRSQLMQSEEPEHKSMAGRVSMVIFSMLQVYIILGLFESSILSSVVKHKDPAPFNEPDVPRLIEEGKFYIVTASTLDWYFQEIERNSASPFYELRKAVHANPYRMVDTWRQTLKTIESDPKAVTIVQDDQNLFYEIQKHCSILLIKSQIPTGVERLMFPRGSPWLPLFNEAILANRILLRRLYKKYANYRPPSMCSVDTDQPLPLTMGPYCGVFLLFLAGILFSCFTFGVELLRQQKSKPTDGCI